MGLEESSLFVSYSHKDRDLVLTLLRLQPDIWYASFIDYLHTPRGSEWAKEHNRRIADADRVLLCWSASAARSKHVEREWRQAQELHSSIIPILLDSTPLPDELDSLHAVTLQDLLQAKGVSLFVQTNVQYFSRNARIVGAVAVVFALCIAFATLFLVPNTDVLSVVIAGCALLLAFGCMLVSIALFRFASRWSALKQRLTDEVIHALKTEVRNFSVDVVESFDRSLPHWRASRSVIVEGKEHVLRSDVEEALHRPRARAEAEAREQRDRRLREEADKRGVMKTVEFNSGAVKCPHCRVIFRISAGALQKDRRCPKCYTFVEPTEAYSLVHHLGHTFFGEVCTQCGCSASYAKHSNTKCRKA